MKATFKTMIIKDGDKNAAGIHVPPDVMATLGGGKKPPVKVTIGDYSYRTTVAVYGGVFMVGVSQAHRAAAGIDGGDEVEVTLELDTEPRTVEVPDDLAAALAEQNLRAAFDALAYSTRKEHVRQVESSKAQETRERRIANIVAKLATS